MNKKTRFLSVVLMGFLFAGAFSASSEAIPTFARKYQTSCMTCHTAFPKLNNFGEAYRRNGYVIPGGGEEVFIKDEPLSLGAPGYTRVFPEAVWPTSISGLPVPAFRVENIFSYSEDRDVKSDFKVPQELALLVGGTFDEFFGYYGDIDLFDDGEPGHIGRLFGQFNDPLKRWLPEDSFNFKVGQFEPAVAFSNHRKLFLTMYFTNMLAIGEGAGGHHGGSLFQPEPGQRGIEINGVIKHDFYYALGVVNGNNIGGEVEESGTFDSNSEKDVYGRLAYKFGGMGFDGFNPESELGDDLGGGPSADPYDQSLTVGAWGYYGDQDVEHEHEDGDVSEWEDTFYRVGFDARVQWKKLDVFGQYMLAENNNPFGDRNEADTDVWFVEANYHIYPWWIVGARYEEIDRDSADEAADQDRIVLNSTFLVRANMRLQLEAVFNDVDGAKDEDMYLVSLDYVF